MIGDTYQRVEENFLSAYCRQVVYGLEEYALRKFSSTRFSRGRELQVDGRALAESGLIHRFGRPG
jgi:hypothetical protein